MQSTSSRTVEQFQSELDAFSGSLTQYEGAFGMRFTEGVRHLLAGADGVALPEGGTCHGAFWILDAIASHQPIARAECDGFQLWTLTTAVDGAFRRATLTCRSDSDEPPVVRQEIAWTDFPLPTVQLYVIDGVALLPGEY